MDELIKVKPVTAFGLTVVGIRIGNYSGQFKKSAVFPVSLRDANDNECYATSVPFTQEQYDAWTEDKAAEDVILAYLKLERA